jgi:hypothetical protein
MTSRNGDAQHRDGSARPDAERTALKEWAVLAQAMGRGEIIAMVRKGGIREQRAGFSVRHDRFVLYPTFFHEKADELAPRFLPRLEEAARDRPPEGTIRIELVASVSAVWRVESLDPLRAIAGEHGLAWKAVESRFRYRDNPVVHVVAVRVARVPLVAEVPEIRRYAGCVSWVELDDAIDVGDAVQVVDEPAFVRRLEALRAALGSPLGE